MKIVVIGGTGTLGSKVVHKLIDRGHDAIAASPRTGVKALTGDGLAYVLTNADVIVDVANSPSFDDGPVMEFFTKSTANLLVAAGTPLGGIENIGGPEKITLEQMARDVLARNGQSKRVVVDPDVGYFGAPLSQDSLVVT